MLASFGISINIVVLFSLIMATGMLVDGAIILVEFADRCMVNGMSPRAAYAEATKRMAWPIFSSITTIIAAFAPMAFWPGTTGEFMKYPAHHAYGDLVRLAADGDGVHSLHRRPDRQA